MSIKRTARHLVQHHWRAKQVFPPAVPDRIEQASKQGEATHAGQVRFVGAFARECAPLFRSHTSRARALDVFSQLRIWDTAHNNGVLLYLLLADRDVEIVADRGIDAKVGAAGWESICRAMEAEFAAGRFERGVIATLTWFVLGSFALALALGGLGFIIGFIADLFSAITPGTGRSRGGSWSSGSSGGWSSGSSSSSDSGSFSGGGGSFGGGGASGSW